MNQPTPSQMQEINYKETLNLPETQFQMRANAAKREPEIETFWEEKQIYLKAQANKSKSHKFVLHDGPPYLSSDKIHIGTALNKILKDIVTRYKNQRGFYTPYVPGYDGHGLPIENAVVKSIKGGRQAVTPAQLRKLCREFAMGNLKGQEKNFKRLGVWGDWENPYVTIDAHFEAIQIRLFTEMYEKGYVYKGLKPVYWCPHCETALADAEVEYSDHTSHSIYIKFPLRGVEKNTRLNDNQKHLLENAAFLIWTTTPWTLPANIALSVHPDFTYAIVDTVEWGKLIIAKELLAPVAEQISLTAYNILGEIKGADLEYILAAHPFLTRDSVVLNGMHVTLDAGTGVVHTAPGHGVEDYEVVQHYHQTPFGKADPLPILSPLDNRGIFTAEAGKALQGQFYEKANPVVVDILKHHNVLLSESRYVHSYPHCWRCHHAVIFRATEQWFINVDRFRENALEAIRSVEWIPARGEARITAMVEGRSDWCISRQRVWGVPIPVFYCADPNCRTPLITEATSQKVYELFKAHTSDIWWEHSADEILNGEFPCSQCGSKHFDKEMDIMDVWFDSGVTHTAVVEARADELGHLPVELYLEGSDQHRGWFQSSLLTSVMLHDRAPYRSVLTHGFVLDENGRKMSKSLGNVVDPQTIIEQYGADVLRLWVAGVDYSSDVRIGKHIVTQLSEVYKKVRNTIRFILGNLSDFDPARHTLEPGRLSQLDRYILHRLQGIIHTITTAFDAYEFYRYYQIMQNFCVVDLSALYFDTAKDILYADAVSSERRRGVQTVLYEILKTLVPMLVPVMPHMAEDIWLNLPTHQKQGFQAEYFQESILLSSWPQVEAQYVDDTLAKRFDLLLKLKEQVNLALEEPRAQGKIGSSLEAAIFLQPSTEAIADLCNSLPNAELANLFILSQVHLLPLENADVTHALGNRVIYAEQAWENTPGEPLARIFSVQANGKKCVRCWKYEITVGENPQHPLICERCSQAVSSHVGDRV